MKTSKTYDLKGCNICGMGFSIDDETEAFWNFCPHCGRGLELANRKDWLQGDSKDSLYDV